MEKFNTGEKIMSGVEGTERNVAEMFKGITLDAIDRVRQNPVFRNLSENI